jgi:gamma-glutamyltranspeptidase/glutathione hydrolase
MMVSLIQSNYLGFGSGIVIPNTGIALQNRGCSFTSQSGHPNCVAGNKRPYHTIIPAFALQDGQPLFSFGVMGGHMQPQGHLQVLIRMVDYGMNPQAALDAPRWYLGQDFSLALEHGFEPSVVEALRRRGHDLIQNAPPSLFGGGQIIQKIPEGYCAASDPRKDGQAVAY